MNPVSNWLNEISFYICSNQYCQKCKYIGKYHEHGPKGQRKYRGTVIVGGAVSNSDLVLSGGSTMETLDFNTTASTIDLNVTNMWS